VLVTQVDVPFTTVGQTFPTVPQFSGSLVTSMHAVPVEPNPTLQVNPQAPLVHAAAPSETDGQTLPGAPQFSGSPLVSMQAEPFDANPASQAKPQVSLEQVAAPF
jgi:hypothetical protein